MLKGFVIGVITGGISGAVFFDVTGTISGVLLGGCLGGLIELYLKRDKTGVDDSYIAAKLQLREEQMDISKRTIQKGEVTIHKEVLTEKKNITIPVTHEELVIEKKVLNDDNSDKANEHTETIRIPVSTERIEVIKHPEILENVEVYKRQFQEVQHIEENLKKEKVHIKTLGKRSRK